MSEVSEIEELRQLLQHSRAEYMAMFGRVRQQSNLVTHMERIVEHNTASTLRRTTNEAKQPETPTAPLG